MNIGVILAGGIGSRMGIVDKPKQFIEVYGKPILMHTVEIFDRHPQIDYIAIAAVKEWMDDVRILCRKYEINKFKWLVEGGETRQKSVYKVIQTLKEVCSPEDILVIHDAVRPLVSYRILTENVEAAEQYGAVDTVIPSADTVISSCDGNFLTDIPQRNQMYLGQTPQSFRFSIIDRAHEEARQKAKTDATDDCRLVMDMGEKVFLVQGDKLNFKITSFDDLTLLKAMVKMGKLEMN